jgi:hypothetical protein
MIDTIYVNIAREVNGAGMKTVCTWHIICPNVCDLHSRDVQWDTMSGPTDITFSSYVKLRVSVANVALILPESSNKVERPTTARIQHPRSTPKTKSQGE